MCNCTFLDNLEEANEFSEQVINVSSAIDELRSKQQFLETFEVEKLKKKIFHTTGNWYIMLK